MSTATLYGIILLILGALVTLSELHTLTIYLLALAAGLFAAGGLALAGGSLTADFALLAVVLVLGLPIAHWWRRRLKNRASDDVTHDDVGRQVTVVSVEGMRLRVSYRGSTWDARMDPATADLPALGVSCKITRRDGNTLIIKA
ncbi:MAG TPA: NfeD family protein [Nevskiaceae bacterium]|nr:NfeD family protein [Nevskiaceae bacterium]